MRQLLPEPGPVDLTGLVERYPWPAGRWVRACMVMSLDGASSGPDGLSMSLSSATDRAVLSATRALADAYLVGARTVRAEDYSPVRARPELVQSRQAEGRAAAPTLVVVSGSCRFDWEHSRFQASAVAPLILTTDRSAVTDRDSAQRAGCEVVVVGAERVDLREALDLLGARGLERVTVEGGPDLLAQVVTAGLLDEADVTLSPTLVGPAWVARGGEAVLHRMRIAHVLEEDGYLFTRYVRQGES